MSLLYACLTFTIIKCPSCTFTTANNWLLRSRTESYMLKEPKNQKGVFSGHPAVEQWMEKGSKILLQDLKIILKLRCFNDSTLLLILRIVGGTSLVVQWLTIHLPVQGIWVRALVQEDPTCQGATKPVSHNYWAHVPQLLKPTCLEPVLHNKRSHHNEKPAHHNKE